MPSGMYFSLDQALDIFILMVILRACALTWQSLPGPKYNSKITTVQWQLQNILIVQLLPFLKWRLFR